MGAVAFSAARFSLSPISPPVWGWVVIGWLALAVLVISMRRPARLPKGMRSRAGSEFVARMRTELRERHPDVAFCGLSARGSSAILVVAGQETPVPLHALFRRFQAFPDAFHRVVDQLVEEIRSEGLHQPADHDFAEVTFNILPQIKTSQWLREKGGSFGSSALVARELGEGLSLCYVIDEPWSMIFLCREHLQRWQKSEEDIFQLANQNLQRLVGGAISRLVPGSEPLILHSGDGYDAAKLLLLDHERCDGMLVAIPERDLLWVGPEGGQDLEELSARSRERNSHATHPISPDLYRLNGGKLERLSPGPRQL